MRGERGVGGGERGGGEAGEEVEEREGKGKRERNGG